MKSTRWLWLSALLVISSFAPQANTPAGTALSPDLALAPSPTVILTASPLFPAATEAIPQPTFFATTIPAQQPTVVPKPASLPAPAPEKAEPATNPSVTSISQLSGWMNPTGCELNPAMPCKNPHGAELPAPPAGYAWKRLENRYTFSAYAHPGEDVFPGDLVYVPGIYGVKAKEGFLYGVDGLGMQGGGFILRQNNQRVMERSYIRYISGHWELGGEDVIITDQWVYASNGKVVAPDLISKIYLADGRFALDTEPKLIPYYSIAASPQFEIGTKIYVPGLAAFGGIFEVQDRGGAFGKDSQRFDIYVGNDMDKALEWIRLGPARSNLVVYVLEKS